MYWYILRNRNHGRNFWPQSSILDRRHSFLRVTINMHMQHQTAEGRTQVIRQQTIGHTPVQHTHQTHTCVTHPPDTHTPVWIKMPLGTNVGFGQGHIVLHGDPASPHKRHRPPILSPCLLWPNGRPSQLLLSTCCAYSKSKWKSKEFYCS